MRRFGMMWQGGVADGAVYPKSLVVAGIYLWTWGFAFLSLSVGVTKMIREAGWWWF